MIFPTNLGLLQMEKSTKIKSIPILSSAHGHPAFLIQQRPKIKGATRNRTQRATFERT